MKYQFSLLTLIISVLLALVVGGFFGAFIFASSQTAQVLGNVQGITSDAREVTGELKDDAKEVGIAAAGAAVQAIGEVDAGAVGDVLTDETSETVRTGAEAFRQRLRDFGNLEEEPESDEDEETDPPSEVDDDGGE